MHVFYMPDRNIAHKNACILYAGLPCCTTECIHSIPRMCRWHPGGPRAPRRLQEVLGAKGDKTMVFYSRKWRDRPFRVHETSATLTKHRKNAVGQRWPVAADKWCMATGKGRNLEETIRKAARRHWEASGRHLEASCRYQVRYKV